MWSLINLILMNKLVIITFIFFSQVLYSQSQYNNFIYDVYKTTKSDIKLPENLDGIVQQKSDTIEYIFELKDNKGRFYPTLKLNNSQQGSKLNLNEIFVKTEGEYYYDFENQIFENKKHALGQTFIVDIKKDSLKWDISNEIIPCFNYSCKKAVLTKTEKGVSKINEYKITVWFTDDVPYNIAPFGLLGLNGLIVKVNFNGNTELILKKMYFNNNPKKIKPFPSGKRLSSYEYDLIIQKYLDRYRNYRNNSVDKSE